MFLKREKRDRYEISQEVTALPGRTSDIVIPNREYFEKYADRLYSKYRHELSFILAYIDLRGFKQVNDYIGHLAGNEVLGRFYRELHATFRDAYPPLSPVIAREGGDEFVVLTTHVHTNDEESRSAINTIVNRVISCGFECEGLSVSSRTGIAVSYPENPYPTHKEFFAAADKALVDVRRRERIAENIHPLQGVLFDIANSI